MGCHKGDQLYALLKYHHINKIIGVDIEQSLLEKAKSKIPNMSTVLMDCRELYSKRYSSHECLKSDLLLVCDVMPYLVPFLNIHFWSFVPPLFTKRYFIRLVNSFMKIGKRYIIIKNYAGDNKGLSALWARCLNNFFSMYTNAKCVCHKKMYGLLTAIKMG